MSLLNTTLTLMLISGPVSDAEKPQFQFESPERLVSSGEPIDVTVGHAAPYLHDFDEDGLLDLLVGEFGNEPFPQDRLPAKYRSEPGEPSGYSQGRLRIYKNHGSDSSPEYRGFEYLKAGAEFASIPST